MAILKADPGEMGLKNNDCWKDSSLACLPTRRIFVPAYEISASLAGLFFHAGRAALSQ
jgi:hypothetical protein